MKKICLKLKIIERWYYENKKIFFQLINFFITACRYIYGNNASYMNILNISVKLKIKDKEYKLILYDNQTAKDFLYMLPMTIYMNDLNGNEKYYNLNKNLNTKTENIGNIKTGDFLLYGSNCIVLFYESFRTSYNYTRLGYIENIERLKEVPASRDIEITFSIN